MLMIALVQVLHVLHHENESVFKEFRGYLSRVQQQQKYFMTAMLAVKNVAG